MASWLRTSKQIALIQRDQKYQEVIKKIINGKELNNEPDQAPSKKHD